MLPVLDPADDDMLGLGCKGSLKSAEISLLLLLDMETASVLENK